MVNYKSVSVLVTKCLCKKCGEEFNDYRLSDFVYGERIILTEDGTDQAYVNCFDDQVFDEVGQIVDDFFKGKHISQYQTPEYFNRVFGYACDYINEKRLNACRITRACINCSSEQLEITETPSPIIANINFPVITHVFWNQNSITEKENIILNALKKEECI